MSDLQQGTNKTITKEYNERVQTNSKSPFETSNVNALRFYVMPLLLINS